ncbi:hypothetical protein BD309DRAFT_885129 [Dichomitus squalens]|uniref:Uncharacterized protein n=1 Tax=Dichomitus squalens TaxID=114155 RepID=A0A4Q9P3F8_9APHY|nr:hypothetical protein BD309DRAFT_885129 [Dichomitus squalens]TBU64400.1 hypothetical protein BD310DRAFT_964201 [Dichomitus squalens]
MFSSFRALRALLVLASVCSPVFSLPTTTRAGLSARALSKRNIGDYIDNLIYLDANKTNIYTAISINQQTYAALLDNKWGGLVVYGDKYSGNSSSQHSIEIDQLSIQVEDGRETIGILEEDVTLEYFHAPQWPSELPHISYNNVGYAYWGIDINNPMSPIYSYFDAKWPSDYSKWYYDMVIFYDWLNPSNTVEIDFAGIIVAGQTVDWTTVLDITEQQVQSYGLPKLDGINSQKEIWLNGDGTFYLDNTVWVNGQQVTVTTEVEKTPSGKYVGDIYTRTRWTTYPDAIVKALYGGVSGAKYYPEGAYGYYQIPCDAKVSFSFSIDGYKYDVAEDALVAINPWGDQCIGSIFTPGQAVSAAPEWDVRIGFQLMSSFYLRAGIYQSSNKPYYKLLPLPTPTWEGYTSYGYQGSGGYTSGSNTGYTSASGTYATGSGTLYSSPSSYNTYNTGSGSYNTYNTGSGTLYSSQSTYNTYSTPTSTSSYNNGYSTSTYTTSTPTSYTYTSSYANGYTSASGYNGGNDYSSAPGNYYTDSQGYTYTVASTSASGSGYYYYTNSQGYTYTVASDYSYGTPAAKLAGDLAATDGSSDSDASSWKNKAHLYEIIIIVLAAVLGVGIIGALIACAVGRRKEKAGPSAYRSLHEAESSGTNAPLYGAEGGQSRYADPYQDKE